MRFRCAAVLFLIVAVVAPPASAAARPPGTLTQQSECFGETTSDGCVAEPFLTGANAVVMTPHGDYVFVADYDTSTVVGYTRSSTGVLTYDACYAGSATAGCTTVATIDHPRDLLVSRDGKSLYVVSQSPGIIGVFGVAADGSLSPPVGATACISADGADASGVVGTCLVDSHLNSPTYGAISPDGKDLYIASYADNSVEVFARNVTTGFLTVDSGRAGCVSQTDVVNCVYAASLGGPIDVDVSPDSKTVYVTGDTTNTLTVLDRAADGSLVPVSCQGDYGGCTPARGLGQPFGVVVSPDGHDVYTASKGSDTAQGVVAHFVRSTRSASLGQLTQPAGAAGCISETGVPNPGNCASGHGLSGAQRLAVAPDGHSVYATAQQGDAVAALVRGPGGALTQRSGVTGCVSESGDDGCADGKALGGATGVAVSPNGVQVLVAAATGGVALFRRAVDSDPPQTTITRGPSGRTKDRTPKFAFRSDEANSTFRCSIDHHAFHACTSPDTLKRLSRGKHRFRVKAIDSWDNVDPTPALRTFRVVKH